MPTCLVRQPSARLAQVGYEPLVDDTHAFPVFVGVPEEHGTAVVVLDEATVLLSADAPRTAEMFAGRGLQVVTVPLSEFEKLEGCVTCLSVRIRDLPTRGQPIRDQPTRDQPTKMQKGWPAGSAKT